MSNSAARIIGLSLVVIAGAIGLGLGSIAEATNPNRGQEAQLFGIFSWVLGGVLFVIEVFASRRNQG